MNRRFLFLISLAWIIFIGLICALAGNAFGPKKINLAGPPKKHDGKEIVTLWVGVILGRWDEPIYREVINRFNQRSKDIYIDATLIPYASYIAKINLAVATGNPPDVVYNALVVANGVSQRQGGENLAVSIPEDMITLDQRKSWSPAVSNAIRRQGKTYLFPAAAFLSGETCQANLEYFEQAGVDIRKYLENIWDYEEFKREMSKVQEAARRAKGPEAYAFGINLKNSDQILYSCLLPQVVGAEVMSHAFLIYNDQRGRYVLDPAVTPELLSQPLRFMQDLINKDRLWGKKFLGMDFGQIAEEIYDRRMLVATFQNSPGNAPFGQINHNELFKKGLKKKSIRMTTMPFPVPRKGMPLVFGVGANGWGVMRQIPSKGDQHIRRALEVARYMASPEVLAAFYRSSGYRINPWPDTEAVLALAPDAPDPLKQDPWLSYLWNTYLNWLKTAETFDPRSKDWPQPEVREALLIEIDPNSATGYLAGHGHQILEKILYGEEEPLAGAREILAGLAQAIDRFYLNHPNLVAKQKQNQD